MRSKVEGAAVQRNEQGTTDAEADQKVSNCGEVEEMRRNEGGGSPPGTRVTEDSMVVNTFHFLNFIVELVCDMRQTKNNSDVVRDVLKTAERVLGIEEVESSTLYRRVFSREGKVKTSGGRTEEDDDTYPPVECQESGGQWARV